MAKAKNKEIKKKVIVLEQGKNAGSVGLKTENACLMCGINNPDNR